MLAPRLFDVEPETSPFNPIATTARLAMQEPAAFHATLALFASQQATTDGVNLARETLYHKTECVRLVSLRLEDSPARLEESMYAVIFLWALEVQLFSVPGSQAKSSI